MHSINSTITLMPCCYQIELVQSGSVRLEMKFDEALAEAVHVLVYAELDSMIEITKGREIVTDYTA